jgi:hypothetical protein
VRCFRRVEGKIEVLGDSACPGEKPEEEKPCELRPCEGVDWVVSDWSGVSKDALQTVKPELLIVGVCYISTFLSPS